MASLRLSAIHVHPVKSARGIALRESRVTARGLENDRRFMIVDAEGHFLTQRALPRLALVDVSLPDDQTLRIGHGGHELDVPLRPDPAQPRRSVVVWDDRCDAIVVAEASPLLSEHLGQRVDLVYMPDDVVRPVDPAYARADDRVGFADGFPVLIASEASLADLNARLEHPVPMNRFRPNLVVEGGAAFEEERHPRVRVGDIPFRLPKRCSRCEVTRIDQATAAIGKEPLKTLSTYRKDANKVYFAMNAIPDAEGTLRVGDSVEYLD